MYFFNGGIRSIDLKLLGAAIVMAWMDWPFEEILHIEDISLTTDTSVYF